MVRNGNRQTPYKKNQNNVGIRVLQEKICCCNEKIAQLRNLLIHTVGLTMGEFKIQTRLGFFFFFLGFTHPTLFTYKMDYQSNAKPSEKDHDLPGI
jgi:hypothetical protein